MSLLDLINVRDMGYFDTFEEYESIEFTLTNGASDYDLDTEQTTFLANFKQEGQPRYPTYVLIRTDQAISVKFNSASNHAISIPSTDSPFEVDGLRIKNVYLSNSSGSNAAVRLLFFLPSA